MCLIIDNSIEIPRETTIIDGNTVNAGIGWKILTEDNKPPICRFKVFNNIVPPDTGSFDLFEPPMPFGDMWSNLSYVKGWNKSNRYNKTIEHLETQQGRIFRGIHLYLQDNVWQNSIYMIRFLRAVAWNKANASLKEDLTENDILYATKVKLIKCYYFIEDVVAVGKTDISFDEQFPAVVVTRIYIPSLKCSVTQYDKENKEKLFSAIAQDIRSEVNVAKKTIKQ